MHRFFAFISLLLVFQGSLSSVHAIPPDQQTYLIQLQHHSRELKLAEKRYWHILLHYKSTLTGEWLSEADGPDFFFSPEGQTNPEAELEATLAFLFSDIARGRFKQPPICAFPARYQWLKEQLNINTEYLPHVECPDYEKFLKLVNPQAITLVFASAYINSPSSMFGHTFFRLDQKTEGPPTPLLDYVINYAANTSTDGGVMYVLNGLAGGFKGTFSIMPYYMKIQEYNEWESRDLWEYRLQLSPEQIQRILQHLWELSNTYFDYFFFKENCSYHLLSLLEVADPELDFQSRFHVWAAPVETLRMVARQPNLVRDIVFRPARSTHIRFKYQQLSEQEQQWFHQITQQIDNMRLPEFEQLDPARKAAILDTLSDYLRYQMAEDKDNRALYQEQQQTILSARSQLGIPSPPLEIPPVTRPPDESHETSRIMLGGGMNDGISFMELGLRASYHELMDNTSGYSPGAQIEFFNLRLRYIPENSQVQMPQFLLINVLSLFPMDSVFRQISWKASVELYQPTYELCEDCLLFRGTGGIGLASSREWDHRTFYYGLLEMMLDYGPALPETYRLGGGLRLGTMTDLTPRWKLHGFLYTHAFQKSSETVISEGVVQQRYTLDQNQMLLLEGKWQEKHQEWSLKFGLNF
ncbi:MAG: DUF4105 domain-containing protein [SAR324 cluster bacterium]|nr:DUF4105 domain-containing protein [SAR324 cluster bacterium]